MICKLYVLKLYLLYEGVIAEDSYPDDINQEYRFALVTALVFQDSGKYIELNNSKFKEVN